MQALTDGSSPKDAQPLVTIDLGDERSRWRYTCPRGHRNWERVNSHGWCEACARDLGHNDDADPEFWELIDAKTGTRIPWSRVIFE